MNLTFKSFEKLPEDAKFIRTTVFVDEQGFVDEFDENDERAIHILMYLNKKVIGTSRIIYSKEHNCYVIGRFAILKEFRKQGYGKNLMDFTEKEIIKRYGHVQIGVSAQERVKDFYQKVGFSLTNEKYLDQDCPHVFMTKRL